MDVAAVLLDLDDTVCQHPTSLDDRLSRAFNAAGVHSFFDGADFRRHVHAVDADSALDRSERCFARIARESGHVVEAAHAVARAYENPDPTEVVLLPGAEAALDHLSSRYGVGGVTNGPATPSERNSTRSAFATASTR